MKLLSNLDKKTKSRCILNIFLAHVIVIMQIFMITHFNQIPFAAVIFISIVITLISLFIFSFNISRIIKLSRTIQSLEELKLYNQSLKALYDDERAFEHDFNNIMQAIGGYVINNDIDGLKTYYSQLFSDCQEISTLSSLTPEVINNPAIYSILYSKYTKANKLGITFNLSVFLNLNELNMKIYEFTRILGILMDNAIEAAHECDEKIINIEFRKDSSRNRQLLIIENTYLEKSIDTERIFEKGFSSKLKNSGIGLWEVRQILNKNNNLNLYTNKDDKYFKQQLEIYKISKTKNALKVN